MPLTPYGQDPRYEHEEGRVKCAAYCADDADEYTTWLNGPVSERFYDRELVEEFEEDIQAMANDGFDTSNLEALLEVDEPLADYWDLGESIADLFLMDRLNVHLPSNRNRDLRTPYASMQGADIVGYKTEADGTSVFLFGEIKTSIEQSSPPSSMAKNGSGMVAQIQRLVADNRVRRQLCLYLKSRSKTPELESMFRSALRNLNSRRCAFVGVLVRDTEPNPADVRGPAKNLSSGAPGTVFSLYVLHAPLPANEWSLHCTAP